MQTLSLQLTFARKPTALQTKNNGVFLPAFKFAPLGGESLFTTVPSAVIPRMSLDIQQDLAHTASDAAETTVDVVL